MTVPTAMAEKLLTDRKCESAKPKASPYRLSDGGGLGLRVKPTGKFWEFRYRGRERDRSTDKRPGRKETTVQIGRYPATSLAEARKLRDKLRATLDRGDDPAVAKRVEHATKRRHSAETFGEIAKEWLEHRKPDIAAVTHERNAGIVRRILLPKLGNLPIRAIDPTAMISTLRAGEKKGLRMSVRRARIIASMIFGHAIATGRATSNPARDVTKALAKRPDTTHYAALQAEQIGPFLTALDASGAAAATKAALLLMLYTGLRDGSLRGARWREIDFEAARWTIPAERMKRREEHSVPLPRQAIAVLRELAPATDRGSDSYIFASSGKAGYLAENTLRIALHRLGFEVTAHGFRSLLTDQLYRAKYEDEDKKPKPLFRSEWIERQMHHKDPNEVRAAYLRTDFYEERVPMMQWWADNCDALKAGKKAPAIPGNVIPMTRAA